MPPTPSDPAGRAYPDAGRWGGWPPLPRWTTRPRSSRRPAERTSAPRSGYAHIEAAFREAAVSIDFAGFSGETLAGALIEPLDKVRSRRLAPSSIRVRMLVPDAARPWVLPCRVDDLADEPAFRQRVAGILDRSVGTVLDAITELRDLDIVTDATAEVRVHNLAPLFKLYLINGREAFFGFYPIAEHTVRAGDGIHPMYDLMGKDSVLFHHSSDDTDQGSAADLYVAQAKMWFDSIWATVSQDLHRA